MELWLRYNRMIFTEQTMWRKSQKNRGRLWAKRAVHVHLLCIWSSQFPGSPSVFGHLHQTLLQQATISLQTMCLDTLPCRHIDGHFLCIPRAERIDSTSIRAWTAVESSHHSLASQTVSQYSQAWKARQYWATASRASGGAEPDWLSWYPISWKMSWKMSWIMVISFW